MNTSSSIKESLVRIRKDPAWQIVYDGFWSSIAGASFGTALTAAGVHSPIVIVDQFRLSNFHMFKVFSVALGSSVFIILTIDKLGLVKRRIRASSSLGLFSKYDGNIIGGCLVGLGMSLSGSCPGTVYPQLAQGIPTASITAIGGVLGGMMHLWLHRPSVARSHALDVVEIKQSAGTLSDVSSIPEFVIYAIAAVAWTTLLYLTWPEDGSIWQAAAPGGLFLGAAQLISLLATSSTLGASGCYDQAGRYLWRILGVEDVAPPPMPPKSLLFAVGAVAGSYVLTTAFPTSLSALPHDVSTIPWTLAFVGGFLMAFGAKLGQGCTSGHGLSGLGALSFSSLVSVSCMFASGILFQLLW